MPHAEKIDPARTALLIMDVQNGIVARYAEASAALLPRLAALAQAARSAGVMVIYIIVAFREGHPEISPRNLTFSAL